MPNESISLDRAYVRSPRKRLPCTNDEELSRLCLVVVGANTYPEHWLFLPSEVNDLRPFWEINYLLLGREYERIFPNLVLHVSLHLRIPRGLHEKLDQFTKKFLIRVLDA